MQLETLAHVGAGAPPSEVAPAAAPLEAPLEVAPLDDAPLDATLDPLEGEPALVEPDDPPPGEMPPHPALQLCSAHWITPLQFRLVQLEAAMHSPRADEHLLLTQALHALVSAIPVTTETKSSGLLHPTAGPPDPPPPPEAPVPEPVPPAPLFWLPTVEGAPPLPDPLPSPPLFIAHESAALNEPATIAVHAADLNIPAS